MLYYYVNNVMRKLHNLTDVHVTSLIQYSLDSPKLYRDLTLSPQVSFAYSRRLIKLGIPYISQSLYSQKAPHVCCEDCRQIVRAFNGAAVYLLYPVYSVLLLQQIEY